VIGLTGALVALAVVLGIVLVLAVRPAARRLTRATAALRGDVDTRLDRLRAVRRARPSRAAGGVPAVAQVPNPDTDPGTPSGTAAWPSTIGGRGRHRRAAGAP
jgi:hypothetical protein